MKRFYAYLVAAFALTAVSCSTDATEEVTPAEPVQTGTVEMTFSASNDETRTLLDYDNRQTLWTDGDTISILDDQGGNNEFTIKEHDGVSAIFTGKVNEGATKFVAVYPYNAAYSWDGTTISGVEIPAAQTCTAGSFPEESNITVAVADENYSLAFKNVCSIIKFQVSTACESVTFASNGTEAVAGTVGVTLDGENIPTATATAAATSIALTCEGGFQPETNYFFVSVPNTFATGIKALVDNREVKKLDTSITINRSKITNLKVLPYQYRIYFLNKDLDWSQTYAHVWNSTGDLATTWPGESLMNNTEKIGNYTYYYYNIPMDGAADEKYNFIPTTGATANSGSGNVNWKIEVDNLKNLTFTEDKYFRLTVRGAVEIDPNDESTFGYTIYVFDQASKNKAPSLHIWDDGGAFAWTYDWPGKALTDNCYYVPANGNNWRHYYYCVIPSSRYSSGFNFLANYNVNKSVKSQSADIKLLNKAITHDIYVGYWYDDDSSNGFWLGTSPYKTPITNLVE